MIVATYRRLVTDLSIVGKDVEDSELVTMLTLSLLES